MCIRDSFLVFLAIFFGCFETCFPALVALRLARVVAAYSAGDKDLIAADGKYLSPVAFGPWVEGLPLFVLHFCFVQDFRDLWDFFNGISPYSLHPSFYILMQAFALCEPTTDHFYRPLNPP